MIATFKSLSPRALALAAALTLGTALVPVGVQVAFAEAPISVNADQAGVVLHGYDPVAYFTEGKPTEGKADFTAEYQGGTYRFASAANRDAFKADPAKFAPQFGGWCAIGTSFGKKFDGDPNLWKIVDGKLFLNVNEGAHNRWLSDPASFIKNANAEWPKIKDKKPAEIN